MIAPSSKAARLTALTAVMITSACASRTTPDLSPIPVSALECRPGTVRQGDTLTIAVPQQFAHELSIETPRGVFFNLIGPDDPASGPRLMSPDSLRSLERLRLSISDLKGLPYVYGAENVVRIFTVTGTYRIRMAERLGTDDGTPVAICEVRFRTEP